MELSLEPDGLQILRGVLEIGVREQLQAACEEIARGEEIRPHGIRNLFARSEVIREAMNALAAGHLSEWLGPEMHPVRAILFDKIPGANWKVPWHQDRTIAVRERHDLPGYTAWTVKEGVPHVEPPTCVLEAMLTLRLHLDDCGPENGPLRVLAGGHRRGKLTTRQIRDWLESGQGEEVTCTLQAGDGLLMCPLLPHASSPASRPGHRRVIHVEYAREGSLDSRLQWALDDGGGSLRRTD